MRATLRFNLPMEREEFDAAIHGAEYIAALRDVDEFLRRKIKDGDDTHGHYQAARDALWEALDGLEIW